MQVRTRASNLICSLLMLFAFPLLAKAGGSPSYGSWSYIGIMAILLMPVFLLFFSITFSVLAYLSRKNKFIWTATWFNLINLFAWGIIFFILISSMSTVWDAFLYTCVPVVASILGLVFVSKKKMQIRKSN